MKSFADVKTDASPFTYLLGEEEHVKCKIVFKKELYAPVEKESVIGTISYELDGKVLEKFSIYTVESVEKATFWNKAKKWLRNMWDSVAIL